MTGIAVARSRDEAWLFLELTACGCGAVAAEWRHGTGLVDGELVSVYDAICPACGADREYMFALPDHETPGTYPNFGGTEPSQLIDAGRWLALADQLAGSLPADDPETVTQAMNLAAAAVAEVIKFIPPGATAVPPDAFWTPEGQATRAEDPARFTLPRLQITHATYRITT
jgi:hypothetical protein